MKKLLLFITLLCLPLLFRAQTYNAGTVFGGYYDVNPDTMLNYVVTPYTNETFSLNIYGDAANDIEFTAHGAVSSGGSAAYLKVTSLNPNVYIRFGRWDSVWVPADSNWDVTKVAKPLNAGDPINPMNAAWDATTLYLTDHSGHGGGNKNVNDFVGGTKYVGLKYQNGSNTSYGWIRVQCMSEDSCLIKDLSFTTSSGPTALKEIAVTEPVIYPNPSVSAFYLNNLSSSFSEKNLKISDALGNNIPFKLSHQDSGVKIELPASLPEGCYFLRYDSEGYSCTKKIVRLAR